MLLCCGSAVAEPATQPWTLYTNTYRPFVTPLSEPDGAFARQVRVVLADMGGGHAIEHIDYGYAFHATLHKSHVATFPWRRSPERDKQFVFSRPLAQVETVLFYDRRAFPEGLASDPLQGITHIGLVAETEYGGDVGAMIARARRSGIEVHTFPAEADAIAALLSKRVQIVPMPRAVKAATMQSLYPLQQRLIQADDRVRETFTLHVMGPDTDKGRAFMDAFDATAARLQNAGVIEPYTYVRKEFDWDLAPAARLVTAEGFPIIIGREVVDGRNQYFALPPGTRVLILQWSDAIRTPSPSDQTLYPLMMDETLVLTLDEPIVGRSLYVKTMHLSLAE